MSSDDDLGELVLKTISQIPIITWNLYGSQYIKQAKHCDEESQSMKHRSRLFKKEIKPFIDGGDAIIFLQEVCNNWRNAIETWFFKNDYSVYIADYNWGTEGLGVMIAFPKIYKIKKACVFLPGLEIRQRYADWQKNFPIEEPFEWEGPFEDGDQRREMYENGDMWNPGELSMISSPLYMMASQVANKAICLKLEEKNTRCTYFVSTYHMPCKFNYPVLMRLHLEETLYYFRRFINENINPCHRNIIIFAGDLNIAPTSRMLWRIMEHYRFVDAVQPPLEDLSQYPITSHAENSYWQTKKGVDSVFKKAIDYIFVDKENEKLLHHSHEDDPPLIPEIPTPIPNHQQPSDHIRVLTYLRIQENIPEGCIIS